MDKFTNRGTPIVLVSMPFVSLPRPSLGLGILKAVLDNHGLATRVEYANLRWAKQVGLVAYNAVNSYPANQLLGDWVFSASVFPDFEPDHEAFLDAQYASAGNGARTSDRQEFGKLAWGLRRQAGVFIDDLASEIVESGAKVVGCTSTFVQTLASLGLLKRIREMNPEIVTVMGGANCEGVMGQALVRHFPWLDYVCSGEGDSLVAPFFSDLLRQGRTLSSVPYGVLSQGATQVSGEVPRATVGNLDEVPTPDFDDYFRTLDRLGLRSAVDPSLVLETSRGCWWGQKHHCTFCGLNGHGMGFRSKSPDLALEQFHTLAERYDCRRFMMADNILDPTYFKAVLPYLDESSLRYEIFYETKANLKRGQLESCARAGVRWIQPGLEALSDPLLDLMDKGTTALTNIQTLKWCRELGIHVNWLALFAFPGDRDEWYENMLDWVPKLLHLQAPQAAIRVGYHRFSPYFDRAEEYGVEPVPESGYAYVYPFATEELSQLAYFFTDPRQSARAERLLGLIGGPLMSWKRQFWGRQSILSMRDDGQEIAILDTRKGGFPLRSRYGGLAREILLRCDGITRRESLIRDLGVEMAELDAVIDELDDAGLVLCHGGQLLGLAVAGELPPVPARVPLGTVDLESWPGPDGGPLNKGHGTEGLRQAEEFGFA